MQIQSLKLLLSRLPADAEVVIEEDTKWTSNFVVAYEVNEGKTVVKLFPDPCLWGDAAL